MVHMFYDENYLKKTYSVFLQQRQCRGNIVEFVHTHSTFLSFL